MWPNPQEAASVIISTEGILNGKLHFLCSVFCKMSDVFIGLVISMLLGFKCLYAAPKSCQNEKPSRIPCASFNMIKSYPWQLEFESCNKRLLTEWTTFVDS